MLMLNQEAMREAMNLFLYHLFSTPENNRNCVVRVAQNKDGRFQIDFEEYKKTKEPAA